MRRPVPVLIAGVLLVTLAAGCGSGPRHATTSDAATPLATASGAGTTADPSGAQSGSPATRSPAASQRPVSGTVSYGWIIGVSGKTTVRVELARHITNSGKNQAASQYLRTHGGTVPSEMEDLQTNMDQALGGETIQYKAAAQLGTNVANKLGPDVLVTGHSLGGGKAQAAGVSGGLTGMMFNAAGLNPKTVGGDTGDPSDFLQFRTPGDPLTGIQNSAALQSGVGLLAGGLGSGIGTPVAAGNFIADKLGFPFLSPDTRQLVEGGTTALPRALRNLVSQGNLLPPAIGPVVTVPALDDAGKPVPMTSPGGQHSILSVINGIEREKSEDVATLQGASG